MTGSICFLGEIGLSQQTWGAAGFPFDDVMVLALHSPHETGLGSSRAQETAH